MKFSWTSIRISIAGARLSHLVQKDRIWDHGSMTEQARIIFYLVEKAKNTGRVDSLKKYMTSSCYENLTKRFAGIHQYENDSKHGNPVITELAVISVRPRKNNKPDRFTALIKGYTKKYGEERIDAGKHSERFSLEWSFLRQGDWWMLDAFKRG